MNDMLNVSRIESGRIELNKTKFNILKLAQNVKEDLSAKALEKNITVTISSSKEYIVNADEEKIHMIFVNLIGNALKFTPYGGTITISFKGKADFVETTVEDNGLGIKSEDIPKLFTKFTKLDYSYSSANQSSGTGLGLYISKKFLDLSGGKIWVESTYGKGSKFSFTLPKR